MTLDGRTRACPQCHEPVDRNLLPPDLSAERAAVVPKSRAKQDKVKRFDFRKQPVPARTQKSARVGTAVVGELTQSTSGSWRLRVLGSGEEIAVEVGGGVEPRFLEGRAIRWSLGGRSGTRRIITPMAGQDLRRAGDAKREEELRSNAPRTIDLRTGPMAAGTSDLEHVCTTLTEKAGKIRQLAQRKNDPNAWAIVMNGYRVPALRGFIQDALRQIGCDKALSLADDQPGNEVVTWPEGLTDWLRAEIAREIEQRKKAANVPKQYDGSDYGLVDI